ncbi:MAG: ATP-binding protein [Thermodesulfobacteriota bacterium]|nr:ATP-binding protein [Thermodesulfobacteriota bacterium]
MRQNSSFFLFGPRGTGKTTWLKTHCADALHLDLLDSSLYLDLSARPGRLENLIPPEWSDWIVLDEIQKIPALLNEVHRLIEARGYRFIMTGSSARGLRKKGVNLLAGRALTYNMFPLTAVELGGDFDLDKSLQYGHLPLALATDAPDKFLSAYVRTYLREEVQQEGLTRNLGNFSRFLETASFSQASVLNISEVAREAGLSRKMVESYFAILEDLLLAIRLPVFSRRARRRMVAHPKFYLFDAGVYRAIRPQGPLDSPAEVDGISLETLVFQEICAINHYLDCGYEIFYWRTSNGAEVDFILYGPAGLLAFEVKRARRWSQKDLSGLKSFVADFPEATGYFLYGGNRTEYHNGFTIMPVAEALARLPSLLKRE